MCWGNVRLIIWCVHVMGNVRWIIWCMHVLGEYVRDHLVLARDSSSRVTFLARHKVFFLLFFCARPEFASL